MPIKFQKILLPRAFLESPLINFRVFNPVDNLFMKSLKTFCCQNILEVYSIYFDGLQVDGGVLYRKFTNSLIFCEFDYFCKHPLRYEHFFLLRTLL